MKILVTGLTTLHWGRMEFGNAGNYYIAAPFFTEIKRVIPDVEVSTTLQFSEQFCSVNNLRTLPLETYYGWRDNDDDLSLALHEYAVASIYRETGSIVEKTSFIDEVLCSDAVVFFHGDMWGDNADANGRNRFFVDILKTRTAQLLGRKTIMFASSPGPVSAPQTIDLARVAYNGFTAVINRESKSKAILEASGFNVNRTYNYVCPAFLFDESYYPTSVDVLKMYADAGIADPSDHQIIGVVPATYSVSGSSFDTWMWSDDDFTSFVELIEHIHNTTDASVVLMPHAYGFEQSHEFKRIHWRDYKMICQIYDLLVKRASVDTSRLIRLDSILYPWEAHAFLGHLDMLISGRVHASVGALSQGVPTLAVSYKNGPLAHKMVAFFENIGMEDCVVPRNIENFTEYFDFVWGQIGSIRDKLDTNVPKTKKRALEGFSALRNALFQ